MKLQQLTGWDERFTGSHTTREPSVVVRVAVPVRITISETGNYENGKLIATYFTWSARMDGKEVARFNYTPGNRPPRTAKAAVRQAKAAAKAYADYIAVKDAP